MRNLVHLAITATWAISVAANSHQHQHLHRLVKKDNPSGDEQRVPNANVLAVYELDGKFLPSEEAEAGLEKGSLVVIGETTPSVPPPPPAKPATTSAQNSGAQFLEKPSSIAPPPKSTSTSQPLPPSPPPKSTQALKPSTPSGGGTGLNSEFPSGNFSCSNFPSEYGARPLDYLGHRGWSGVQNIADPANIRTAVSGEGCEPGSVCSYACPAGYQKTQWPEEQGKKGESFGGLLCNSDGKLELTRESHRLLCTPGAGDISVRNELTEVVSTCRTDYPGTESMTIPTEAGPGEEVLLTNPIASLYYTWDGKPTSAQYYVNRKGLTAREACLWNCALDQDKPSAQKSCGNWAPIIIGAGRDNKGVSYISVFQNSPTSSAKLDFNVNVTGSVTSECGYKDGNFIGGSTGCTTSLEPGGKAVILYY
ncbi:SUN domain-containing protein [Metarhizium album ARSEF 1941]|uniref:SUN domain-containing protein n=1 Tax=Metarhizium album (strain ARSEF 1941) TaxID=1081103 RepID=A0A0B2WYS5_METAS|nr:SUN domain-containing protein [Metarhizium album ARSEF 1941]KHN98577.1 SUN domain-containing protein [Metarhizium album ARSEF 1941]